MLKKILAASTAGVLALTALATTAMADDAAADKPDITIERYEKTIDYEFVVELKPEQIQELIGDPDGLGSAGVDSKTTYMTAKDDDTKNTYSNVALSIWTAPEIGIGSTIKFKGATVNFKLQGQLKDQYMIQNGTAVGMMPTGAAAYDLQTAGTISTVAPGIQTNVVNSTSFVPRASAGSPVDLSGVLSTALGGTTQPTLSVPNATGVVTDLGTRGGPAGYVINNANGQLLGYTDQNPAKGIYDKDYTVEKTIPENVGWLSSVNTQDGKASQPVMINAAFGLSATTTLQGIDFDDSVVKVTFTMSGTESDWAKAMSINTGASGTWNWNGAAWSSLQAIMDSAEGQQYVSNRFGLVGESGVVINGAYARKAGMSTKATAKINNKTEVTNNVPLPLVASVPVGVGQNASIPTLQKMNNGGTMKFEFDQDLSSAVVVGTVIFYGTSGQVALPVGNDYAWEDSGKTLVMDFPADLTYDPSMNNMFNSFKASYNISINGVGGLVTGDDPTNTNFADNNSYKGHLMKIKFYANAEAPKKDDTSSSTTSSSTSTGGLVSGSTTTSSTPATSATNSGSNSGEKNPGTGVAVAVAPVVLAATAAAVVISKKRK